MQIFTRIFFGLLFFSFSACQKDLGVELPYEGNRLIIFGLLSADSVVSVKIGKTSSPTGVFMYGDSIPDAKVELFEDGVFLEDLEYSGKGIHRSPSGFKPSVGKSYHLTVSAALFPTAQTDRETVPEVEPITGYLFQDTTSTPFTNETARRLTFTFLDTTTDPDYYYAGIEGRYKGNFVALNTFVADRPLEASEDVCSFRSEDNQYVLQDICFNGRSFSFDIGIAMQGALQESNGVNQTIGTQVECDQILLRFRKITKPYRDYLYRAGTDNEGFFRAFTIPTSEYTNIKDGYGLWAAYSEDMVNIVQ